MSERFSLVLFLVFLTFCVQAKSQAVNRKHWMPGIGRVIIKGIGNYEVSVSGYGGAERQKGQKKGILIPGIEKVVANGSGKYEINVAPGLVEAIESQDRSLGSRQNPAPSCRAIRDNNGSAPSGPYYIKTDPAVTKVYCYMKDIPGCGGGGWTTIMKTSGYKTTFRYQSAFWSNKIPYHVTNGQSGVDERETKLPTYWTLPFSSLCLGMKTRNQKQPNWILVNYKASSLYSVIADGKYRSFSVSRSQWKSLISDSSLQKNCNREGFNNFAQNEKKYIEICASVRIGIIANQENDCKTPDSRIGFGGDGRQCGYGKVNTGNCAGSTSNDNGQKTIAAFGYILAQ